MRVPTRSDGHEVGRELDPLEVAADGLRHGLDRHRLGEARDALDEEVAAREERDDHPLQQVVLADDDLLDLVQQPLRGDGAALRRPGAGSGIDGVHVHLALSERGKAGAAAGDIDGHGQADADEHVLVGGVDEGDDDADDPAGPIQERAAGVARVDGRVDLDEARRWTTSVSGSRNVRSRPETTPALMDPYSPNGLPTMYASLPMRSEPGLPSTAGGTTGASRPP